MKRISTLPIKRLLVLSTIVVAAVAPQAAKAEAFFAPDNGFGMITASCDNFFGVQVQTVSTSGYQGSQKLWGRTWNGTYGPWEVLYDWQPLDGNVRNYSPVRKTYSRYVQLYVEVAFLTGNGWQISRGNVKYANYSSELGGDVYWCYT
jgi:hypothetical protein